MKKILIIEDSIDMQKIYNHMLADEYEIHAALDLEEAWKQLSKIDPDLIILDIILPKNRMGDEFFIQFRQKPQYQAIPVIVISILDDRDTRKFLEEMQNIFWIPKPFKKADLLDKIRKLI